MYRFPHTVCLNLPDQHSKDTGLLLQVHSGMDRFSWFLGYEKRIVTWVREQSVPSFFESLTDMVSSHLILW